jgi:hypothetical protein
LYYARWRSGEVDLVSLDPQQRPRFAVEVKWSDRAIEDVKPIKGLLEFSRKHNLGRLPLVTTLSVGGRETVRGIELEFTPSSLHCYTVAKNTLERRRSP